MFTKIKILCIIQDRFFYFTPKKSNEFTPYHFAINIPSNKEIEALQWLRKRVSILKDGKNEIQGFYFWNAKAIYFYDVDKNIVELTARKNLKNESQIKFTNISWIEISEFGMPAKDIKATYRYLNQLAKFEKFSRNFETFCAIGDEHGLFICIDKDHRDWFPTNDKAYSSIFEVIIEK